MDQINQVIQAGYSALQRGAFSEARRHLQHVNHPKAIHLLGLVEKGDGNLETAIKLLKRAAHLDQKDPEIANNLALLARDCAQPELAESEFRRAINLRPNHMQAKTALGRLLIDTEKWQDALAIYEPLMQSAPHSVPVRYGLGTAKLGAGEAEDAEALFDTLIREGNELPEILFMRARARLELGQVDPALADLEKSHKLGPSDFSLRALASTYWMIGDQTSFDELLGRSCKVPGLAVTSAEILRQSGKPEQALTTLGAMRKSNDLSPESWSVAAMAHVDLNQAVEAESAAKECLLTNPDDHLAIGNLISSLLMQGKAQEAMPFIDAMRTAEPNRQHWIAYEATALRLMGSDRYGQLVDLERFVRPYRLSTPAGFDSIEDFNAQFLDALDQWHQCEVHPLDQSLRDGSQTPRDLTCIDDPVIRAYVRALDIPIRQYMADVGSEDDHPLTARNTGKYRITGCWSVRLHGGGHHVNHVHPEGWISSCYYISVPEETLTDPDKAGWIKFAEPPFETSPPSPAEKWIRPEAGMLVLFPSFLWHGTQPIHDGSERVTAPFDAVPA